MNKILVYIPFLIATTLCGCCNGNSTVQYKAEKICEMPDIEPGYGQGVSACYAATSNDALFIAGGCNFPGIPASEGGEKIYYKGIYCINTDNPQKWEKVGELTEASAYGANIQHNDRWNIVGGMNSKGSTNKAYSIELNHSVPIIKELPPLPCTMDNLSGTAIDNTLYVLGGNSDGKASNKIFSLNTEFDSIWIELPSMPGAPRIQPVCAGINGCLYVWGGFAPADGKREATVHCDGLRYDIKKERWENIGKIMGSNGVITLSGGATIAIDEGYIIAGGGVNKEIFLDAISGRYNLVKKNEYMYKPINWYKFNKELLMYDCKTSCWKSVVCDTVYARAGAQYVKQGECIYQIGGELKPGIRTPDIYKIEPR